MLKTLKLKADEQSPDILIYKISNLIHDLNFRSGEQWDWDPENERKN